MAAESPTPSEPLDPLEQGCLIGQKRPLKPKDVWTVRVRPQLEGRKRDRAMFNLAIDSNLDCHLIRMRTDDVCAGGGFAIERRWSRRRPSWLVQ